MKPLALNFNQCEEELRSIIANDRNDERIYQLLHDITFNYLYNVLKPGTSLYDYDVISWDLAADIYLRIRKGTDIQYFTNYIARTLNIYYLKQYEHDNWSVIIDTSKDYDLERNIQTGCVGIRDSEYSDIENILTGVYLGQFENVLNSVMRDTKFNYNSKERLNIQISILLTLLRNKPVYFHLDDSLKPYINLIIMQIKNKVVLEGICQREAMIDNKISYQVESYTNDM